MLINRFNYALGVESLHHRNKEPNPVHYIRVYGRISSRGPVAQGVRLSLLTPGYALSLSLGKTTTSFTYWKRATHDTSAPWVKGDVYNLVGETREVPRDEEELKESYRTLRATQAWLSFCNVYPWCAEFPMEIRHLLAVVKASLLKNNYDVEYLHFANLSKER
jgi:hypothetical protein